MSTRVRRTAEEARRLILDAAEKRLADGGPEGLRLQEIARDVGVSHPAILHHFESRAGLVTALARRATERLEAELLEALAAPATENTVVGIVDRLFEALTDTGQGRLLAWLALSGEGGASLEQERRDTLRTLADAIHTRRCEAAREQGSPEPELEDSEFVVRLAAAAMLGEGAAGSQLDRGLGANDTEHAQRFRAWFGRLLLGHVAPGSS
ncbi:MAG: TetR/AcrR family transcriptional regulator [Myxococcales bacterium]|nr:TetR/AcrR family transcriptional regulator [Myxococcales bacterium]